MARPLRIDYPYAWHHVMNRSRRGHQLFADSVDYQLFIDLVKDTAELFNVRIVAYCLMPNHYHLLSQTPDANLSRCMRHINGVYTQRYNSRYGFDGTLFRGRYKSILVDVDSYLLQLVRYIHNNPIKAGLAKTLHQYIWTSHKGYLSKAKKWDWLHKDFILEMFDRHSGSRIKAYKQFMAQDEDKELLDIFKRAYLPSILGKDSFTSNIKKQFFRKKINIQVPDSKKLAPEIEAIIIQVCKIYEVNRNKLVSIRRGASNEPRDVAIYLIRSLRSEPLAQIAPLFHLNHYSSVSSAVIRIKNRVGRERKLKKRLETIKAMLYKGQTET